MRAKATFSIDSDSEAVVTEAARWIAGFYPRVAVSTVDHVIVLSVDELDAGALATIWAAALANERLYQRAASARERAFEALARS